MNYRIFDLLNSCLYALNSCSNQLDMIQSNLEDLSKGSLKDNLSLAEILVNDSYEGIKDALKECLNSIKHD